MKKLLLLLFVPMALFAAPQGAMKIHDYPETTSVGTSDLFLLDYWNGTRFSTNKNISFTNLMTQVINIVGTNGGGGSPFSRPGVFNVVTYGGASTNGASDVTSAVQSTFDAAQTAGGGIIEIPAPFVFNISGLTNTDLNNVIITGGGTLKANTIRTNWLQLTGDGVYIQNVIFDGEELVQTLFNVGANSDYWLVENCTFRDARVTNANDPLNTPSTGSATARAFRFNNGSKHLAFVNNDFLNISYEGTHPYLGGVGRTARALHFAPFPTATNIANAIIDVRVINNRFINNSADGAKVDNDAVTMQNIDEDLIPDVQFVADGNLIDYWGWRGFKMQCSGITIVNNKIIPRTTAGLAGPIMRSGIEWFGHSAIVSGNTIGDGSGTCEHPINVFGFDYYPHFFTITHNVINLTAAQDDITYGIWIKNAANGVISDNVITNGIRGIYLRGWCQNISITGNIIDSITETALMLGSESDPDGTWPFNGKSANNVTITGTIVNNCETNGVRIFPGATNVTILGTQGVLSSGNPIVNQAAGTGSYSGHNQGIADSYGQISVDSKFTVNSTNGLYASVLEIDSATGNLNFLDKTLSRYGTVNTNRDVTWGSTAFTNRITLAGQVRLTTLETTVTNILASGGNVTIQFDGILKSTHTQSGAITVIGTGMASWQEKVFELTGDGSAITWPAWTVLGRPLPSSVPSGKILYVTLSSMGTTAASVRVRCWLQDRNTQAFVNGVLVDNPNFKDSSDVTWSVASTNVTLNMVTNRLQEKVWVKTGTTNNGVFDFINFWPGTNIVLTATNGASGVDISINSTATGSGGGTVGTMISSGGTFVAGTVPYSTDTTGTNFTGSSTITITGTNVAFKGGITVDNITATNGIVIGGGGTNLVVNGNVLANGATFTNTVTLYGGTAISDTSTNTLTNKTLDAAATGNTLKFIDYLTFVYPSRVDGTGCTIVTNDYTSSLWGLATTAGTGSTNANYALFRLGFVPPDIDTSVEVTLNLAVRVSGTDTDAAEFTIAFFNPASSSGYSPTDFTGLSTFINFDTGTLTSPAANDIFYTGPTTLTGWAAGLTTGRTLTIGIARRDGNNDDSVTIVSGYLTYTRTK